MHPALSVIFFTTVSGMGYGLLFLLGLLLAIDPGLIGRTAALLLLATGAAFAAAGLLSSMLHLGQPLRAWRAFSQWRSSWLSREGVAAMVGFAPIGALALCLWHRASPLCIRALGIAVLACAMLTVFCTARIYTSLKTIPRWRHRLVLPGYASFALLGGAAWLWMLLAVLHGSEELLRTDAALLVALGCAACAVLKHEYWKSIDAAAPVASAETATGLGRFGNVRGVEAPHTEENYLTHEMGFVLARRHAARLRVIALVLFAVLPVAASAAAMTLFSPSAGALCAVVAVLAITAGTFVERWLFFAEAKHVVMLYYAGTRD
jgi:sulfite dehydrogenase (quinone) subunit SoeC